jgi:hypothetical protein
MIDDINWRGKDYVPILNVDAAKITSNPGEFVNQVKEDMLRRGMSEEAANAAAGAASKYVQKIDSNGFYHYGQANSANDMAGIVQAVDKAEAKILSGVSPEVANKQLQKALRAPATTAKVRTSNPLEQERFLKDLSEEFWSNWTTGDVKGNILAYVQSIAERAAHVEKFGKNNERYFQRVREALADAVEKGHKITSKDIKNFIDVINISQRIPTYSVSPGIRKSMNRIRAFENITKLPLALLPSLAEVMIVTDRNGTVKSLSSVGKVLKESLGFNYKKALGSTRDQTIAEDLGLSLAEATNVMSSRTGNDTFSLGRFEQGFFNLTLLPQFTEMLRTVSANAAYKVFMRDAETFITTDNAGVKRQIIKRFSEAGLDAYKVADWYTNTNASKNDPYYKDYIRMGLLNIVEDTVVNPKPIQRAMWTSDERFRLLSQLKSFAMVFSNGVMRTWYDRIVAGNTAEGAAQALKILPIVATMIVFQVYIAGVREFMKTGNIDRWEDDDIWDHMLTGASYLGMGGFVADPLRASSFGADATSTILGPAASDFNKAAAAFAPLFKGEVSPEDLLHSVLKSYPDFGLLD